jgi:hypothetical protein
MTESRQTESRQDIPDVPVPMHSAHPLLKLAAPLVVLAATWATEKVLAASYTAITGSKPPNADDRAVSFSRALAWTVATAATAAVVQVVIYRAAAKSVPADD